MMLSIYSKIDNAFNTGFSKQGFFIKVNHPVIILQSIDLRKIFENISN